MEEIEQMDDCYLCIVSGRLGSVYTDDQAILSKLALVGFSNESAEQLAQDVQKAYHCFKATSTQGKDMVYDRIDASRIATWWK